MTRKRKCCLIFTTGRSGTVYLSFLMRVLSQDGRLILHEESTKAELRHLLGSWGVIVASRYSAMFSAKELADLWNDKDVDLKFVVLARDLFQTVTSWLRHYHRHAELGRAQVTKWASLAGALTFNPKWPLCQMFFWHWFSIYATAYKLRAKGGNWRFFKFADLNSVEQLNGLLSWVGGFAPADAATLARVRAVAQYKGKKPIVAPHFARELRSWLATLSVADKALVVATGKWLTKSGVVTGLPRVVGG